MAQQPYVRPIAICVLRRGEEILVGRGYDRVNGETFCRPLGGEIDFGESSRDTIVREIREEIGAGITEVRCLGAIENLFTFEGAAGHEIVMVYDARFADETLYQRESIAGCEHDGTPFAAEWKHLDYFRAGATPLYPDGLLALLDRSPYSA